MKKLFVSLLAIAGMVACTNDEVVSVQQGNPIAFDTFVENTTRVGYDSSNLPEGFNVWAFIETENGNRSTILDAEDVTRQGDQYVYGNTQYWVPGNTYYFAALAPMDSQNVTNLVLATGDAAKKGLGTFDFNNDNGTEDLIYAVNKVEASETTSKVTFTFKHLLSKVKFSFTNTFDNANYSIEVRDIAMTVPMSGNVNLAADDVEWTLGTTSLGLDFDETGIIAKDGSANSAELLTIPAGEGQKYTVSFYVDLYVGNGTDKVLAKTYEKKSTISGIKFEAGKAYNFAANINAESLALNEVIFDASVNGWDDAATVQLIDTAAELRDAFGNENVNHIILDGNIDLSDLLSTLSTRAGENAGLVIGAGRTLTLDLNGCTISQSKAQTGAYAMIDNKGTLIIEDNSSRKEGKIVYGDTGNGGNYVSNTISNSGVLTINSGTIENNSSATVASNGYPHPIDNSGVLTINGGTFTNSANYSSMRIWCTTDDDTIVTINGGTFNGSIDFQTPNASANKGTLTINGGTFNPDTFTKHSVRLLGHGADVDEMNGYIKGGHFTGKIGLRNFTSNEFNSNVFYITGGTFTVDPSEFVDSDYNVVVNNGVYSLERKADVAMIGEVGYTSLQKAVAAVQDGETITLVANETFTEKNYYDNSGWKDGLGYAGDKSFTIDLGGKTVSQNGALNDYLIWIKNVGSKANTITIKNGTLDAGTTAYCALCTASSHDNQLTINLENITLINKNSNGSTVKVRAGSVVNVKAGTKITGKDSYLGIENWKATVNIYDGAEIYMNGTSSYNGCLAGAGGGGTINVYGGYGKGVKGGFIAMTSGGTINVSGGEWIANTDGSIGNNSNLYVLTAQSNKNESGFVGGAYINVTGGTFRGGMDAWVLNNVEGEEAKLNISGGNFNANPSSYLAEGCEATEVNGVWTVRFVPATRIGETEYDTLQEAFNVGGNITLLRNVTVAETVTLAEGKTAVLDLNGFNITVPEAGENGKHIYALNNNGNMTIKDSKSNGSISARGIYNGAGNDGANITTAKLTIESGKFIGMDSDGGAAIFNYGELIVNNGIFNSIVASINTRDGSKATINGGTYSGVAQGSYVIQNNGGELTINNATVDSGFGAVGCYSGKTTINNGSFLPTGRPSATCHVVYVAGSADVTIKDGTFKMNYPTNAVPDSGSAVANYYKGTLAINGGTFYSHFDNVSPVELSSGSTITGGTYYTHSGAASNHSYIKNYIADGYELNNGVVVAK